jgi:hypothetical protein
MEIIKVPRSGNLDFCLGKWRYEEWMGDIAPQSFSASD